MNLIIKCPKCGSENIKKNGKKDNKQRFLCKDCLKTFTDKPTRVPQQIKDFGLALYLNNMGIRKIAKLLYVSPPAVLRWIKNAHKYLEDRLNEVKLNEIKKDNEPDIIELDEIYAYVKKRKIEQSYGLLILGNKNVLLHLK